MKRLLLFLCLPLSAAQVSNTSTLRSQNLRYSLIEAGRILVGMKNDSKSNVPSEEKKWTNRPPTPRYSGDLRSRLMSRREAIEERRRQANRMFFPEK